MKSLDLNFLLLMVGVLEYPRIRFSALTKILDYHLVEFVTNTCYIAGNYWQVYNGGGYYGYSSIPGLFFEELFIEGANEGVGSRLTKNLWYVIIQYSYVVSR